MTPWMDHAPDTLRSRYRAMQLFMGGSGSGIWKGSVKCTDCGWVCGAGTIDQAKALFREHRRSLH